MKMDCDEFDDEFVVDADEESLKHSFYKISKLITSKQLTHSQLTVEQEMELDKELFGGTSPYSLFRNMIGFFENQSCTTKFKFRFMSGTVKDNYIDNTVTHVFVEDNNMSTIIKTVKVCKKSSIKIVKCKWIEDCFRNVPTM